MLNRSSYTRVRTLLEKTYDEQALMQSLEAIELSSDEESDSPLGLTCSTQSHENELKEGFSFSSTHSPLWPLTPPLSALTTNTPNTQQSLSLWQQFLSFLVSAYDEDYDSDEEYSHKTSRRCC